MPPEAAALPEAAKTIQPGFARWKCTPLGAAHHFPRRGKFALRSALGLISTSMHSTAKSSPSGGKVVPKVPKGVHFLRAIGAVVWFFLCYCPICKLSPPPSTKRGPLPQAAFITPSEPARPAGGTHRSARSARTIEPGRRRRLNPLAFGNTAPAVSVSYNPNIFLNPFSRGFFVCSFHRESMKSSGLLKPMP